MTSRPLTPPTRRGEGGKHVSVYDKEDDAMRRGGVGWGPPVFVGVVRTDNGRRGPDHRRRREETRSLPGTGRFCGGRLVEINTHSRVPSGS